eukprot:TRINITY_DN6683_c0_g2_i1.p1 TRINITY_DN6683_c0_g2~~TRINITY_DN6683_c0_g2_i1.p1  ORF type:complete len:247 (-),score=47.89 TRINITY_DN6683_c0_g2_i1:65-805(-)
MSKKLPQPVLKLSKTRFLGGMKKPVKMKKQPTRVILTEKFNPYQLTPAVKIPKKFFSSSDLKEQLRWFRNEDTVVSNNTGVIRDSSINTNNWIQELRARGAALSKGAKEATVVEYLPILPPQQMAMPDGTQKTIYPILDQFWIEQMWKAKEIENLKHNVFVKALGDIVKGNAGSPYKRPSTIPVSKKRPNPVAKTSVPPADPKAIKKMETTDKKPAAKTEVKKIVATNQEPTCKPSNDEPDLSSKS